jgi:2,3-bisphosphoglycerate-independent phosphoglycerate mutase
VGPVWRGLEERGEPYRMIIAMDHRTPVSLRGHSREPVPILAVDGPTGELSTEAPFDEFFNDGIAQGMVYDWIAKQFRAGT